MVNDDAMTPEDEAAYAADMAWLMEELEKYPKLKLDPAEALGNRLAEIQAARDADLLAADDQAWVLAEIEKYPELKRNPAEVLARAYFTAVVTTRLESEPEGAIVMLMTRPSETPS